MKKLLIAASATLVCLLLAILLLPSAAYPARAAGAQAWQFKTSNYTGTPANQNDKSHAVDKLMSLQSPPGGPAAEVSLPSTSRAWWYMDQAANVNVSLGSSSWEAEVHVYLDSGSEEKTITVKAWKVASDGTAVELASGSTTQTITTTNTHYVATLTAGGSQTIPPGWTVACSVEWSGGTSNLKIGYNNTMGQTSDSWCKTPTSDPGYPNFELSTLILFISGLAVVGGAYYIKNRRAIKA